MSDSTLTKKLSMWGAMIAILVPILSGVSTYAVLSYKVDTIQRQTDRIDPLNVRLTNLEHRVGAIETDRSKEMDNYRKWREDVTARGARIEAKLDALLKK